MARVLEGSMNGANVEIHKLALTGTTALPIVTKFSSILSVFMSWAEEPDDPTYQVYLYSVSAGTVNIKCTHATTVDVYVQVWGRT